MGTYAGFFLPSILIPIFTLWAYYLSFMKYSFEALEQNEWSDCASYYMLTQFLSLDLTLNRWTNLLVLMAYPVIFHLAALLSSLVKTGALSSAKGKPGTQSDGPEDKTQSAKREVQETTTGHRGQDGFGRAPEAKANAETPAKQLESLTIT
jgi:hypothetical protein